MMTKSLIAVAAIGLMLAAGFAGCIGDSGGKSGASSYLAPEDLPEVPMGLDAYGHLEMLPCIQYGIQAKQVSGHDRGGGNWDGYFGTYSSLYVQQAPPNFVLFDEKGPGCLYRMWMTDTTLRLSYNAYPDLAYPVSFNTNIIEFYFDGESTPRISMTIAELFSGTAYPFLYPLVGNELVSSGGFYFEFPLMFEKSLKIATYSTPFYLQLTYQIYPEGTPVKSFDADAVDEAQLARVLDTWKNAGADPKDSSGNIAEEKSILLQPGGSATVFERSGYGVINSLKLWPGQRDDASIANVWIEMYWDGESKPSVRAPIDEFFGCGLGEYEVRALTIGMIPNDYYYCYFPMPYGESAKIVLVNNGTEEFSAKSRVEYAKTDYDGLGTTAGYFHATWHEENPTLEGTDFKILEANGVGKFVGIIYTMSSVGSTSRSYLEGDERIHFEGSRSPAIYGTGTEDYFSSGWYSLYGLYSLPTHGTPAHEIAEVDRTMMYRLQLFDYLPFYSKIKFGMEHGPVNDHYGNHTCVAYWYGFETPQLLLTDEIDVGKEWSEKEHSYMVSGETGRMNNTFQFEGDDDTMDVIEDGVAFSGKSVFTMKVDPNNVGVRLRRLVDIGTKRQEAKVIVDGKELERTWYDPGCVPIFPFSGRSQPYLEDPFEFIFTPLDIDNTIRWLETEYDIPSECTKGKDRLNIEIQYVNSADGTLNEYHYWAYSYVVS